MTSHSKFDVDLTRIVKSSKPIYIIPDASFSGQFSSYEEAEKSLVIDEAARFISQAKEGAYTSPDDSFIIRSLLNKDKRERIKAVIDYLDRD